MRNKRYIVYLLMVVGMIMLIVPLMPHHHHSNGIICMRDDIEDIESPEHHHHDDDPCCASDCMTQFDSPAPAPQLNAAQPQYIYSITLFTEPLLRFITQHEEQTVHRYYVYLESLHSTLITCAVGLRAPPSFII